jgi:hypothetical protein
MLLLWDLKEAQTPPEVPMALPSKKKPLKT